MAVFHVVKDGEVIANVIADRAADVSTPKGQKVMLATVQDAGPGWKVQAGRVVAPEGYVPVFVIEE